VPERYQRAPYAVFSVPCVGDVHTAWLHSRGAPQWVAFIHCQRCYYRLGAQWLRLRVHGRRRPRIAQRALRERIFLASYMPGVWEALEQWEAAWRSAHAVVRVGKPGQERAQP
jgi:hypothetical protein